MTGETPEINHSLKCYDKCVLYLVTCKQYNKQYNGESTDQFRNRRNNYKDNARKFDRKEGRVFRNTYVNIFGVRITRSF